MNRSNEGLLEKLVQINALHPQFVTLVKRDVANSGSFVDEVLLECERHVAGSPNQCSDPLRTRLEDEALRTLLNRPPAFASCEGAVLRVLASIADVHPDENGSIKTDDPVMQYILEAVRNQADTTTVERLNFGYYQRLAKLRRLPLLIDWLRVQASEPTYIEAVGELESWLDALSDRVVRPRAPQAVPEHLADVLADSGQQGLDSLRASPRLAQVPQEHVLALPAQIFDHEPAGDAFQAESVVEARLAKEALHEVRRAGAQIDTPVDLRLAVAHEILDRRKFAKMQVLELAWPEVYGRVCASGGQQRLKLMEQSILQPEVEVKLPSFWQNLRASESLESFLRIPPYFHEIYAPELSKGLKDAQPSAAASANQYPIELGTDAADLIDFVTLGLSANGVYQEGASELQEVALQLSRGGEADREGLAKLPYARILAAASRLIQSPGGPQSRDLRAWAISEDDLDSPSALGKLLWDQLFLETRLGEPILECLSNDQPVRLLIRCDGDTSVIPWECLSIPQLKLFDARSRRFSIVRRSNRDNPGPRRNIGARIRILVVHAVPDDVPLPSADQEIDVLDRTLSSAVQAGIAQFDVLKQATAESLQHRLRSFQPHVFHFIGHGVVREGKGNLVLIGDEGRPRLLTAEQVGIMLQDEHILLAVLNACDAGSGGGTGESVASVLADTGVPAAIAPTRLILDDAALWFSRAFYSALMDGLSVEPALSESRKALSLQGWDWSAYALYAPEGPPLDRLRLESRRGVGDGGGIRDRLFP